MVEKYSFDCGVIGVIFGLEVCKCKFVCVLYRVGVVFFERSMIVNVSVGVVYEMNFS